MPLRAEIIAVGSELLTPFRLDTNSLFLTAELNRLGIVVARKHVVGDDLAALTAAFGEALHRADVVIATGGLGPTEDDLTREAAAAALSIPLVRSAEAEARLRARFATAGMPMPARNLKQADRLEGAELLANGNGSAPGQWLLLAAQALVLLPGPPRELKPLFQEQVAPRLRQFARRRLGAEPAPMATRALFIADRPESAVDEIAAPIYRQFAQIETTILAARPGEIELHLRAVPGAAAEAAATERDLDDLADRLAAAFGDAVFSRHGESLEAVVGDLLRRRHQTLAVAESCTAGLLGARLTNVAGASDYFLGGVICYRDQVKIEAVGVDPETLALHGAVSAACARELAEGVRRRLGADWGLAITGIAGPGGGSAAKPVGTVFIALAGPTPSPGAPAGAPAIETEVIQRRFTGDRDRVRHFSVAVALDRLRLKQGLGARD